MSWTVVFDTNETLLNLEYGAPTFERILGDRGTTRLWCQQMITYSQALTISDAYVPFMKIRAGVLGMLGEARGISLSHRNPKAPDQLARHILQIRANQGWLGAYRKHVVTGSRD
jgi:hypothetical protein